MTEYQLITRPDQLSAVYQRMADQRAIGVDTETTSLDPLAGQLRLLQLAAPEMVYILDLLHIPEAALTSIKQLLEAERPVKILHNAKFDAKMLLRHFSIELNPVFDTMLASQLSSAGDLTQPHRLEDLAWKYLGRRIDKSQRESDWSGQLSRAMLDYAAHDVALLHPLRRRLIDKIKELQLIDVAKLEFDCVLPTAAMELAGVYLHTDCWQELVEKFEAQHRQLEAEVKRAFVAAGQQVDLFGQADINLNSPQQVQDALAHLGIPIRSTRELELEAYARQYPVVAKLIEYRRVHKFLSGYGRSLFDHIHTASGRIHADFRQIGTPTGRFSCSRPNIQQIPNIPEVRACFQAPPGRKLVVADYSQIELRILAEFSRDAKMMEAFLGGVDLHRSTASLMFKIPLDEVTKEHRAIAKSLNFGLLYGMGAAGLAARIEAPLEEAQRFMARYFDVYRGVANWLRAAADTAVSVGHSRTHWGRLWNYRFDPYDREQVATVQRLGKNAPIQGCLAGDTLIYTDNGLIRIEALAKRTRSATRVFDGRGWQSFRAIYSGPQRIAQLTLENGVRLKATHDHPILVLRGGRLLWVELERLRSDDWVCLCRRPISGGQAEAPEYQYKPSHWPATWKTIPLPGYLTPEFAESLGRLGGDGWYGRWVQNGVFFVVFGQREEEAMKRFITTLTTTFPGLECSVKKRDKETGNGPVHRVISSRRYANRDSLSDLRLGFDYSRVARVEDSGTIADTYDLIVNAREHRFVANGIIVHNTSADILKRAMRLVYDALRGCEAQIVNSIHDEIEVEADERIADEVAGIVRQAMTAAAQEFIRSIPVEVDVTVATAWTK